MPSIIHYDIHIVTHEILLTTISYTVFLLTDEGTKALSIRFPAYNSGVLFSPVMWLLNCRAILEP